MSEKLPAHFGNYVLEERIGAGGMAEVYRARMTAQGLEKQVCIKRILPHLSRSPQFVAMFKDEAKLMAGLSHEHIVSVFESGEVDGALYLAMELIEGCSLASVLEEAKASGKPLSLPLVLTIAVALAKALHHAHTATRNGKPLHLVHRDVSPHNVLLGLNRQIKLADFGVAHAEDRLARTETGALKGKLQYASPEQVRTDELDHRSDQFAFGIVLWEMLVGRRLFEGKGELQIMDAVLKARIAPPSSLRPDVPKALDEVVLRMLERDADQRFHHMGEVADLLGELLFAMRAPPSATDTKPLVESVLRAWRAARPAALPGDASHSAPTAQHLAPVKGAFKSVPMVTTAPEGGQGAKLGVAAAVGVLAVVLGVVIASRADDPKGKKDIDETLVDAGREPARTTPSAFDIAVPRMRRIEGVEVAQRCTSAPQVFASATPPKDDALYVFVVDNAGESAGALSVPIDAPGRIQVAVAASRPVEVRVRAGPRTTVTQLLLVGPLTGDVEGGEAGAGGAVRVTKIGGVLAEFPDRSGLQEHAATLRRVQSAAGAPTTLLVRGRTCTELGVGALDLAGAVGDDVLPEDAWRALSRDVDRARVPPPDCAEMCGPEVQSASARDVVTTSQERALRQTIDACLTCVNHSR